MRVLAGVAMTVLVVVTAGCTGNHTITVEARLPPSATEKVSTPSTTLKAVTVTGVTTSPGSTSAGSGQTLTVQPANGLRNGQLIHIVGTRYKPNEKLIVAECAYHGLQTNADECNLNRLVSVQSDAAGKVTVEFPVFVGPFGKANVVCGQPIQCLVAVSLPAYSPPDEAGSLISFGS